MKKTKNILVVFIVSLCGYLGIFSHVDKISAEMVSQPSSPNSGFVITYDNVNFGVPGQNIFQSPSILYNFRNPINKTNPDPNSSESGLGYDKMNFDGTVALPTQPGSFGASTNSNARGIAGTSIFPGVYKAYFKAESNQESAVFPVTYFIFYPIYLEADSISVLQGENFNLSDLNVRGNDGVGGNISSQSNGITFSQNVDVNIPGSYPVNISFNDPNNIYGKAEKTVSVNVVAKPTIDAPFFEDSLVNQPVLISNVNIIDSGNLGTGTISSIDVKDENGNSLSIESDGTIKPSKAGLYTITYIYNYTKPNGEPDSVELTRTLKVNTEVIVGGDVIVHYVDTEGKKISDDVVKSGNVGEDYSTDQKTILGYRFKEVQGNTSGKFTDKTQVVTYIYTKNLVKAGDVTIHYVDTAGNKISDDIVKSGNVGESFSTEQKAINGYTFKEVQGNPKGQFTDKAQTITYVYIKDKVTPKPDDYKPSHKESALKPDDHKLSHKENINKKQFSSSTHNTLPETGENEGITLMSIGTGLILLMIALIASIFRFKRFKSNK